MSYRHSDYDGRTYYGRPQLRASPFNVWAVGGYIFLSGLSGAAALLAAVADGAGGSDARRAVRRGRYLSLLVPVLGAPLLILDLHTPRRFLNMLRVAKGTSPMSIGTWLLVGFSGVAGLTAAAQWIADRRPGLRWPRRAARVTQVPAAVLGAGLSTYTAALLAATSTPPWAAAPRALGVQFGASSLAAAASALAMREPSRRTRRQLDRLALAALTVELAAAGAAHQSHRKAGVAAALDGGWGRAENGVLLLGQLAPLALHALLDAARGGRGDGLRNAARLTVLAGSLALRVVTLGAGNASAERADIALRFAQPDNLGGR